MITLSRTTEQAMTYESLLSLKNEQSTRLAWRVAAAATGVAVLAVVALVVALPLKNTELRVVAVDSATGMAKTLTGVDAKTLSGNAALDRFFAVRYVTLREGYNYMSLQRDYDAVQVYSSPQVKADYLKQWSVKNSPDVVYGQNELITIDPISVVIQTGTGDYRVAQIRYRITDRNLANDTVQTRYSIANLTFTYDANERLSLYDRTLNPLGFTVTS